MIRLTERKKWIRKVTLETKSLIFFRKYFFYFKISD
jgi:hypothetical protein